MQQPLPCPHIAADLSAGACLRSGNQLERQWLGHRWKELLAAADDQGHDREHQLIHQVGGKERLHHRGATIDIDVAARLSPQIDHGLEKVLAADDGGWVPGDVGLAERVGNHILLHAVDPVGEVASPDRLGQAIADT